RRPCRRGPAPPALHGRGCAASRRSAGGVAWHCPRRGAGGTTRRPRPWEIAAVATCLGPLAAARGLGGRPLPGCRGNGGVPPAVARRGRGKGEWGMGEEGGKGDQGWKYYLSWAFTFFLPFFFSSFILHPLEGAGHPVPPPKKEGSVSTAAAPSG